MSHSRKDTFVKTTEWMDHLRPFGKRRQAKRERLACRARIRRETEEGPDYQPIDWERKND